MELGLNTTCHSCNFRLRDSPRECSQNTTRTFLAVEKPHSTHAHRNAHTEIHTGQKLGTRDSHVSGFFGLQHELISSGQFFSLLHISSRGFSFRDSNRLNLIRQRGDYGLCVGFSGLYVVSQGSTEISVMSCRAAAGVKSRKPIIFHISSSGTVNVSFSPRLVGISLTFLQNYWRLKSASELQSVIFSSKHTDSPAPGVFSFLIEFFFDRQREETKT